MEQRSGPPPFVRPLVAGLVAAGLLWFAKVLYYDAGGHWKQEERHTLWVCMQLFITFACVASVIALVPGEGKSNSFGRRLRRGTFKAAALLLELALISLLVTFVWFAAADGSPPLHWGRVGGQVTDWVIDFGPIYFLILAGAILNLAAILGA